MTPTRSTTKRWTPSSARRGRRTNGRTSRSARRMLMAVYDLMRMGPTSANCCPARFLFLTTQEAKERLKPHSSHANQPKTMQRPGHGDHRL